MADVSAIPYTDPSTSMANIASAGASNAQAALTGQQAQQASMNTDVQRASMPLIMQALHEATADSSGMNSGNSEAGQGKQAPGTGNQANADQSGAWYQGANIEDTMRQQNYVTPYTPQELQMLKVGTALSMNPSNPQAGTAMIARMQAQRQARIDQVTSQNQLHMGNLYDSMDAVTNAPPGSALDALTAIAPKTAAEIKNRLPDEADEDAEARKYAGHVAAVSHLYSGRPTKMENGQLTDEKTGQAVTGQQQLFTGLTGEQRQKAYEYAQATIPVKFTDGTTQDMPRWKAPQEQGGFGGAVTPNQYVLREDRAARQLSDKDTAGAGSWNRVNATAPPPPGMGPATSSPGAQPPPPPARPAVGVALHAQAAGLATPPNIPVAPSASQGPPPAIGTPQYTQRMTAALNDSAYKAPYNPDNLQHTPGVKPAVDKQIDQYLGQRKEAQTEFSEHSASASQALMNFNAAKAILSSDTSPIPTTGPIGAIMSKLSALGYRTDTADARQEAAKYLTNAAVAQLKQTYGARPGVFDVKINVEKAFPSIENQGISAVKNLIDSQISQATYMRDSATRGGQYIAKGMDPVRFNEWQEKYFPRANLVTPQTKAAGPIEPAKEKDPQAAYDALPAGAAYMHEGKTLYKGGKQ